MGQLFLDKNTSDVEIICGERTFDCHQMILSVRSPVFRAMFQNDMAEKRTNRVEIQDLSEEVVAQMLRFIYTGSSNLDVNNPDINYELLEAAEKYQLELLKKICANKLKSTLTVENCIQNLIFAETHRQGDI